MKKTFQRLIAAAVAIPVALGQVLSVSVNAAETQQTYTISMDNMLMVEPETGFPMDADDSSSVITFTQESDWNTVLAERLGTVNAEAVNFDIKTILDGLNSPNYYVNLLKDIVAASGNPTATMKDGVVTIQGTADMSAYLGPDLQEKLEELGYENEIDTSVLKDVAYEAVITTDFAASKSVTTSMTITAAGETYTIGTLSIYLDKVYTSLSDQILKAVDEKAQELADEYGITKEEVLADPSFNIQSDLEQLESVISNLKNKIQIFEDKYAYFKNLTTNGVKEFKTADDAVAMLVQYMEKHGIQSAGTMPTTVDGMVEKYGAVFNNAITSANNSLTEAGVNVQIGVTAADVAKMLTSGDAGDFKASAVNGDYTIEFRVDDAQYSRVEAYVEAQVAELFGGEKEVESVETEKIVKIDVSMAGAATFDVTRDVTVSLKDKATVTTTSTDDGSTTTTTASTTSTDDSSTTTTGSTTSTDDGSTTTTGSTTSTDDGSTTTSETTTLPVDVESISVELLDASASNGVYFSDEASFDPADLIASVVLTLNDGTEQTVDVSALAFAQTPAEVYATVDSEAGAGNVYFMGEVGLVYTANPDVVIDTKATVAVAMKGDTNLDGAVDTFDAYDVLQYYAEANAGTDTTPTFAADTGDNVLLTKLLYYVSDIDTESKLGVDSEGATVDTYDAYYQLALYAAINAGDTDITWDDILNNDSE